MNVTVPTSIKTPVLSDTVMKESDYHDIGRQELMY